MTLTVGARLHHSGLRSSPLKSENFDIKLCIFRDHGVNLCLMLQEDGTEGPGIDDLSPVVLHGGHAPDHEHALDQPVEGHPANQDISKEL